MEFKQKCPYHPNAIPVVYRTVLSGQKYIKNLICGHKGCEHKWTEDVSEQMAKEFNG